MNKGIKVYAATIPHNRKTKDVHEWAHYIEEQLRLIRGLDPQTSEK